MSTTEYDDWLYIQLLSETSPGANDILPYNENWNLLTGTVTVSEDWGHVSGGIGGALQLGPLRRQFDRQKFNKEGGFSKEYGTVPTGPGGSLAKNEQDGEGRLGLHLGGGYTIENFKDVPISFYISDGNLRAKIVMNSHITLV